MTLSTREQFDALFASDADPWKFRDRWYEARKRALTLACLPRARYARGCEPACANGELSAALALRCEQLLISDGSQAAVDLARRRVAGLPGVTVAQAWLPEDWPAGHFDLVVVSEVGYYLAPEALDRLAGQAFAALGNDGDLVVCHWRHPIPGCALDGDAVHRRFALARPDWRPWTLEDPDFRLEVWSTEPRSVAQREGLRA